MKVCAVIPARMWSSRFPGKPLALLAGKPLIQRVWEGATREKVCDRVLVAADNIEIVQAVHAFGGEAVLTSPKHKTGTDRVAEVAAGLPDANVILNIQGDQPFVTPALLHALLAPYVRGEVPEAATLACPLGPGDQADPGAVKVLTDRHHYAIAFTRAAVPYFRTPGPAPVYRHIGLYAFRKGFLDSYARMEPGQLEEREELEQLRILEHGWRIRVVLVGAAPLEVNTPTDLKAAEAYLEGRR